jgi:hypothetical protein
MKRLLQSTFFAALFVASLSVPTMAQTIQPPAAQCYAVVSADHLYPADGLDATKDDGHFRQCFGLNPTPEQQQRIKTVLGALRRNRASARIVQQTGSTFFFFDSRSDYESYFAARNTTAIPLHKAPTGACGDTRLFPSSGLVSAVFDNCTYDNGPEKGLTKINQNPLVVVIQELERNMIIAGNAIAKSQQR